MVSCKALFISVQAEVNFLGRLSHPNLVKLLGYCYEGKELLLVYELMQRGNFGTTFSEGGQLFSRFHGIYGLRLQ
uniref:Putative ephrin type-A receptor 8 n=1 Tax=Helianthus annuus TaxID=4232 RepID=A0A251UXJ5_HELAN